MEKMAKRWLMISSQTSCSTFLRVKTSTLSGMMRTLALLITLHRKKAIMLKLKKLIGSKRFQMY